MEAKKWMGAIAAAALLAAPAMAQEDMDVRGSATMGSDTQSTTDIEAETETELGTGGSGEVGIDAEAEEEGTVETSDPMLFPEEEPAYGGSGDEGDDDVSTTTIAPTDTTSYQYEEEDKNDMRGLVLTLGGGVEGYTGALGDQLDAGPAWGVSANLKPSKVLGIEVGYSGAANEIGQDAAFQDAGEQASGADVVRNGAHALATVGLTATAVQPYALAGLGLSHYTVRADTASFDNDWSGSLPVGAGLRTHIGNFTADLRGSYSFLFDHDLAVNEGAERGFFGEDFLRAGRWVGSLQVGTTW